MYSLIENLFSKIKKWPVAARATVVTVLAAMLVLSAISADAQRRGGSFSSGRSSFGGGRSYGGSFNSGRSGSSFGSGRTSGGSSFGGARSGSSFGSSRSGSSFGRSGSFGSQGIASSRSVTYNGRSYTTSSYYVGGRPYHAVYVGGWGDYWYQPRWYYWMPFHPAFYFGGPVYVNDASGGYYAPGGFSVVRLILGLLFFGFLLWIVVRLFSGGRKRVRYTNY